MRGRFFFGFTVVELLIVIVVIGIIAGITPLAYRGVQNRAHDSAIQSDLTKLADIFNVDSADSVGTVYNSSGYGISNIMSNGGFKKTTDSYMDANSLLYCADSTDFKTMVLMARSKSGNIYYVRNEAAVAKQTSQTFGCSQQLTTIPAGSIYSLNLWTYGNL